MATSAHELRKSWKTLGEMMSDRGLTAAELVAISPDDFAGAMTGKYNFHVDLPSVRHRIIYELNSRFKSVSVKKLVDDQDFDVFVIVSKEKPSSTALKGLEAAAGKEVQIFNLAELQFNISQHSLVPRHEPIRDEASIEAITSTFQVRSRFHFPLILTSDPMARYLGLKHGQLVRIHRISPSAGTYVMYRCCMKS
jgi:DNA-directed RNA polymerase I, II, and III subunit RPABC1